MALSESEELELLSLQREKSLGVKNSPSPSRPQTWGGSVKGALLNLAAPGGVGRITDSAMHSYDQASYDLGGNVAEKTGSPELGYAANVAASAVPAVLGGGIGSTASPLFKEAGRGLMQSAIGPSAANLSRGKVEGAIETMLQQGYNATNAGVASMKRKAEEIKEMVKQLTDNSGKLINTTPVRQNIAKVEAKAGQGPSSVQDIGTVQRVEREIFENPNIDQIGTMSVKNAQAMKERIQAKIGDAGYGLGLKPAVEKDALKAGGRGFRQAIEYAEPGVRPLNAAAGELRNAVNVAGPKAALQGNQNPLPLGASLAASVSNPAAALGMYANSSAYIKSLLARLLYSGSEVIPTATGAALGAKLGVRQNSNHTTEEEKRAARIKALQEYQ